MKKLVLWLLAAVLLILPFGGCNANKDTAAAEVIGTADTILPKTELKQQTNREKIGYQLNLPEMCIRDRFHPASLLKGKPGIAWRLYSQKYRSNDLPDKISFFHPPFYTGKYMRDGKIKCRSAKCSLE